MFKCVSNISSRREGFILAAVIDIEKKILDDIFPLLYSDQLPIHVQKLKYLIHVQMCF